MSASAAVHGASPQQTIILSINKELKWKLIYGELPDNGCLDVISRDFFARALDQLGDESAKAQKLQVPITSAAKLATSTCEDCIYLMLRIADKLSFTSEKLQELGFIRIGKRDLYFNDGNSLRYFANCICVLDFYLRPQRCGYGKLLFDVMLRERNISPNTLAYDRPSSSMISFLKRHYLLDRPLWQHNHFVIFAGIFTLI